MSALDALAHEPRPRDFAARYRRSRPQSMGKSRKRQKRPRGRGVLLLAAAVALPALAQPQEWDRFTIGDAGAREVVIEPMPFEKAGSSFPGSAFYYLDFSEPVPGFGEGIRSDADSASPLEDPLAGPAAQALRVDRSGIDRTRAVECLTAAIYYEAASEPDSGQRAVAQVVLNRVAHPSYPSTVCGVVYQGSQRRTGCQFTFTCDGSLARRPNRMFWQRAENVARAALAGYVHVPAGLATHYHTTQVNPYWAASLRHLATIGAHRFYRFKGNAGQPGAFRFAYLGGEPTAQRLKAMEAIAADRALLDPATLQQAFDDGRSAALAPAASARATTAAPAPAPAYTTELEQRGGDALYRGDKLPEATGIRPEYRNSGRWIARPGS